jgi:(methylthio)acryloyl-CoA hydratase
MTDASTTCLTYELDGKIALIGLNRPDKRNAINDAMVTQLSEAVSRAAEEAHCGVIFGHGSNFSSGLDLGEALAKAQGPRPLKRLRHNWHTVFDQIARGPIPWVGALHGAVLGGGLELAASTHIRVADSETFFGLPEAQRGIFVGGGGTVRVQRILGNTVMTDMMLTGRLLTAIEGERVGIVRYVEPAGQSLQKARELAHKISQNTLDTNWKIVNVLPRVNDLSHDDGLFMEYLNSNMMRSPEVAERLKEFVDGKSKPLQKPPNN